MCIRDRLAVYLFEDINYDISQKLSITTRILDMNEGFVSVTVELTLTVPGKAEEYDLTTSERGEVIH